MYYPRFTKVIIHYFLTQDKTLSWRNNIGMHTSRDDYLINTLRFVSTKEETQIYGVILPESLTSPGMKETKAYKTYLGFATRATPPKKARKFKKPASPKLTNVPVSTEEPTGKSKRVKRPTKKSTKAPARDVVIRETPEMPFSKKKEKTHPSGSGTIAKTASSVEIKPSIINEGTGVKPGVPDVMEEESFESEAESWGNNEDDSNNDQSGEDNNQENASDDDKTQSDNENESDSEHETDENDSGSESDQVENEEDIGDDEEEVKDEFVKTLSNNFDDKDETKITDKAKGDEDEEIDYTTSQLYDDVDIRLNEPVDTEKGFIQEEGTNAKMTNIQQGNENPEISQVIEDDHVTLSTVLQKTEVPVTSSSHSSDLAAKFLNFSNIPHTDEEIVSLIDVHIHHEVPSKQTPILLTVHISVITDSSPIYSTVIPQVTTLEKEVAELKKDPLHTQVTTLVDDHLDARLGAIRDEFMNHLSAFITARITKQVKIQLLKILPKEVSNFAPPEIQRMAAATLTEFELDKILINKMDKSESYLVAPEHRECYEGLIKSYDLDKTIFSIYGKVYSLKRSRKDKDKYEDPFAGSDRGLKKRKTSKDSEPAKEELEFEVADSDMLQDQEEILGQSQSWVMTLASSADKLSKTFDELMSTPIDFSAFIMNGLKLNNLTQETLLGLAFRLLKGTRSNYAELEYDFEECYKALLEKINWENLDGGDYPFDLTKPLPLVMSEKHQKVPVDYFFNNDLKYLQGGVSTMTYTTSITKTKASQYDLSSIEDMVLDIYGFLLKWPMINTHYRVFLIGENNVEEGDFPRLRINDIEDMLLLVVQNRLTNLSGYEVSDFAIALRMFTRSLVI
ncbi:hypothetical protein Tco_0151403 [Tanacetum coccineum]